MVCELSVWRSLDVTDQFMVVGPDEVEDLTAVSDVNHGLSHAVLGRQPTQFFTLLPDLGPRDRPTPPVGGRPPGAAVLRLPWTRRLGS